MESKGGHTQPTKIFFLHPGVRGTYSVRYPEYPEIGLGGYLYLNDIVHMHAILVRVGILHQNFKLFPSFSLAHTMIEEALTYNLVFVL